MGRELLLNAIAAAVVLVAVLIGAAIFYSLTAALGGLLYG